MNQEMTRGDEYAGLLFVGQHIHCILYGGHDGYVLAIQGQQTPATIKRLGGGAICTGGSAQIKVRLTSGFDSVVPEAIIRGVQWYISDEPADTDAIDQKWAEAKAETERQLRAKAAEATAINARFAGMGALVVGPDQMAITAQLCYDDSDIMTDYFHTAPYGPSYCLAIVKRGARTERAYRAAVNRYPELAGLTWKWDRDDCELCQDGGPYIELAAVTTYGGLRGPNAAWRIDVVYSGYAGNIVPFKGYPGPTPTTKPTAPEPPADQQPSTPTGYTVAHERDWTWITFASKPADEVIAALGKNLGARFSGKRVAWYITQPVDAAQIAAAIG